DASGMGAHVDRVPAGPKNTGDDGRGLDIVPLIPFKISEWTQTVGKPTGGFPEAGAQHPRCRRFEHGDVPQECDRPSAPLMGPPAEASSIRRTAPAGEIGRAHV